MSFSGGWGISTPVTHRRYSHATVSRWESGFTLPSVERLVVFARALGLSRTETEGLLALAGLASTLPAVLDETAPAGVDADDSGSEPEDPGVRRRDLLWETGRFLLLRVFPLGMALALIGFLLSLPDWNPFQMTLCYFAVSSLLVVGQGLLLPGSENPFREFFWVSVFFVLSTPLLQFAPLGMDHYNLYFASDVYAPLMPSVLALMVNLALAGVAGLVFHILWSWQYRTGGGDGSPLSRALWVVLPPMGLVHAVVLVTTNVSISLQLSIILPALAGSVLILLIVKDPGLKLSLRTWRTLNQGFITFGLISMALGIFTIVTVFISPDLPAVLPDHSMLGQWEINFGELGFSRDEALKKMNLGYVWHGMTALGYMFLIVAGKVVVSIHPDWRG